MRWRHRRAQSHDQSSQPQDVAAAGAPGASAAGGTLPLAGASPPLGYPQPLLTGTPYQPSPVYYQPPVNSGSVWPGFATAYPGTPTPLEDAELQYALAVSAQEHAARQAARASQVQQQNSLATSEARARAREAAAALSQKYWMTGCLGYQDVIPERGFFEVSGDFPEVEDLVGQGRFPSLDVLQRVRTAEGDPREVVLIDRELDPGLSHVEEKAAVATAEVAHQGTAARVKALARVVVESMGGTYDGEDTLSHFWLAASDAEKKARRSAVIQLARLSVGSVRHRALLFKVLADSLNIKCMLQKGVSVGGTDDLAAAFVNIDNKEYIVDLVSNPGELLAPSGFTTQHNRFKLAKSRAREKAPLQPVPVLSPPPGSTSLSLTHTTHSSSSNNLVPRAESGSGRVLNPGERSSSSSVVGIASVKGVSHSGTAQSGTGQSGSLGIVQSPASPCRNAQGGPAPAVHPGTEQQHKQQQQQQQAHHHAAHSFDELAAHRATHHCTPTPFSSSATHPCNTSGHTDNSQGAAAAGACVAHRQQPTAPHKAQSTPDLAVNGCPVRRAPAGTSTSGPTPAMGDLIRLDSDPAGREGAAVLNQAADAALAAAGVGGRSDPGASEGWVTFGNSAPQDSALQDAQQGLHVATPPASECGSQRGGGQLLPSMQRTSAASGGSTAAAGGAPKGAVVWSSPFASSGAMAALAGMLPAPTERTTCPSPSSGRTTQTPTVRMQLSNDAVTEKAAHLAEQLHMLGMGSPPAQTPAPSRGPSNVSAAARPPPQGGVALQGPGSFSALAAAGTAAAAQAAVAALPQHAGITTHHVHRHSISSQSSGGTTTGTGGSMAPCAQHAQGWQAGVQLQQQQAVHPGSQAAARQPAGSTSQIPLQPQIGVMANSAVTPVTFTRPSQGPLSFAAGPYTLWGHHPPPLSLAHAPPTAVTTCGQAQGSLAAHRLPGAGAGAPTSGQQQPELSSPSMGAHLHALSQGLGGSGSGPSTPLHGAPVLTGSGMGGMAAAGGHTSTHTQLPLQYMHAHGFQRGSEPFADLSPFQQQADRGSISSQQLPGTGSFTPMHVGTGSHRLSTVSKSGASGSSQASAPLHVSGGHAGTVAVTPTLSSADMDCWFPLQQAQQQQQYAQQPHTQHQQQPYAHQQQYTAQQQPVVTEPDDAPPQGAMVLYSPEAAVVAAAAAAALTQQGLAAGPGAGAPGPTQQPQTQQQVLTTVMGQPWWCGGDWAQGMYAAAAVSAQGTRYRPQALPQQQQQLQLQQPQQQQQLSQQSMAVVPGQQGAWPMQQVGPHAGLTPQQAAVAAWQLQMLLGSGQAGVNAGMQNMAHTPVGPSSQLYSPPYPGAANGTSQGLPGIPASVSFTTTTQTVSYSTPGLHTPQQQPPMPLLTGMPSMQIQGSAWEIDPQELDYSPGQRIGMGSYGEVFRGMWRGTEVAIKRFLEQNLNPLTLRDFKAEVSIMTRLRHPNIVLFLGAVVQPSQLAIVTEFVPRGSLFRMLHRSKVELDPRRRYAMAVDIAKGMLYLHSCKPMVVHRDLKSANLLVDRDWTVKVCDFGLSQFKSNAFLTSKTQIGTPEWMAPEILRNERCDERSDVFSYGVILWELVCSEPPWSKIHPMQVVGAVGYSKQRLDIPGDLQPDVAVLIRDCWQEASALRPSFKEVLERLLALRPAQLTPSPARALARAEAGAM